MRFFLYTVLTALTFILLGSSAFSQSDTLDIGQVLTIPVKKRVEGTMAVADSMTADTSNMPKTLAELFPELDIAQLENLATAYYQLDSAAAITTTNRGVGTWLEDYSGEDKKRFYALHKSEPEGSIIKVKHMLNNREVFVKVVGPLPENDTNRGTILKLSSGAAEYLGILDKRFLVEVTAHKAGS